MNDREVDVKTKDADFLSNMLASNITTSLRLTLEATTLWLTAFAFALHAIERSQETALPFLPKSNASGARTEESARVLDFAAAKTTRSRKKLTAE